MRYELVSQRDDFDPESGIMSDLTIRLVEYKSKKLYPETIRMVRYHDYESDNDIDFITNNFEINALEVACLYWHRWDIEVFFKWIKQNVIVKLFGDIQKMQYGSICGLRLWHILRSLTSRTTTKALIL